MSDLRARLQKASAQLKADGHHDDATAVDAVLAPGGWSRLVSKSDGQGQVSLPLSMSETLRDQLKETAKKTDSTLGASVTAGFKKVVAGQWEPPRKRRRPTVPGVRTVVLNVRGDKEVRQQLEEMLPALTEKLGFKVTVSYVAVAWLRFDFDIDED